MQYVLCQDACMKKNCTCILSRSFYCPLYEVVHLIVQLCPQESLEYFGKRRTDLTVGKTFQGVETPSQVSLRYH